MSELEIGRYSAKATSGRLDTWDEAPVIDVKFDVLGREMSDGSIIGGDELSRDMRLWLSGNAKPHTRAKLDKMGCNMDFRNIAFDGRPFIVELSYKRDSKDNLRERWDVARDSTPPPVDVLDALTKEFSAGPIPPPVVTPRAADPAVDDDLPF